jgi:hypothetical protein
MILLENIQLDIAVVVYIVADNMVVIDSIDGVLVVR